MTRRSEIRDAKVDEGRAAADDRSATPLGSRPAGRQRWPDPRQDAAARKGRAGRDRAARIDGRNWRRPRGRGGFSLLELMLAMTLSALLTLGAVRLFASAGQANAEHVGQARLQESARHALGFLGVAIRGAGYLGCGATQPTNGLRGDWRQLVEVDVSTPIAGLDGGRSGWTPPLAALPLRGGRGAPTFKRGINPKGLRAGTDVLIARRLAAPLRPLLAPAAASGDSLNVPFDRALRRDDFAVLSKCGDAALFRVTSVARQGPGTRLARAVGAGAFGNRPPASTVGDYGGAAGPEGAAVGLVLTEFFFIARGAGLNNRGQPVWSLWRKTSVGPARELVRGINNLQLLFGIDTTPADAVDAPTRLVAPPLAASAVARSVQVVITASAVDAVGAAPITRAFAATFAVRGA